MLKSPFSNAARNWLSRLYVEDGNIYMDINNIYPPNKTDATRIKYNYTNFFTVNITNLTPTTGGTYLKLKPTGLLEMYRTDGTKIWDSVRAGARIDNSKLCGVYFMLGIDRIYILTGIKYRERWLIKPRFIYTDKLFNPNRYSPYGTDDRSGYNFSVDTHYYTIVDNISGMLNGGGNNVQMQILNATSKPKLSEICVGCPFYDFRDLTNRKIPIPIMNGANACAALGINNVNQVISKPGSLPIGGPDTVQDAFYDPNKICSFSKISGC
jgi:hypothetical protein